MDKELKAKWVAALRSGQFSQGNGWLFYKDRYCCLGVLGCVVNGVIGPDGAYGYGENRRSGYTIAGESVPKLQGVFMDMNDGNGKFKGERKSFAEIADFIEANL